VVPVLGYGQQHFLSVVTPAPPELRKGPKWLRAAINDLRHFALQNRPLRTPTCEINQTPQGTQIIPTVFPTEEGGGDAVAESHPFKVYQRVKPGTEESPIYQYGVDYRSSLYKSLKPGTNKQTITGLLNEAKTTGWFDLSAGGYIWLGITFNTSGNPTAAVIDNSDDDTFDLDANAWSDNDSYVEDNGGTPPTHQTSRKLIAVTASGSGAPVIYQVMRTQQVLRNVCIDGRPARYPFDHEGGYPL
jgi:hypothetical protein